MTALAPTLTAGGVSIASSAIEAVVIDYGRRTPNENCLPSTAAIAIFTSALGSIDLGSEVVVSAGGNVRFRGTVDTLDVTKYVTTMSCTSTALGVLAKTYPSATAGQWTGGQQYGIGTAAMVGATWSTITATNPEVLSVTFNYTTSDLVTTSWGTFTSTSHALDFLNSLADMDPGGYLYETPGANTVNFVDSQWRSRTDAWTLPTTYITADWHSTKNVTDLCNNVGVTYLEQTGVDFSTWTTASTSQSDTSSSSSYGVKSAQITTVAGDRAWAERLASTEIAHRGKPRWITNPVTVDVRRSDATLTSNLMAAVCGTRIATPISSYVPNFPTSSYIEGWTETITNVNHTMDLYLSDVLLSQRAELWQDVTPALTYAGVGGTVTWRDVLTTWL